MAIHGEGKWLGCIGVWAWGVLGAGAWFCLAWLVREMISEWLLSSFDFVEGWRCGGGGGMWLVFR